MKKQMKKIQIELVDFFTGAVIPQTTKQSDRNESGLFTNQQ